MPADHATAKERERVVLLYGGRRHLLAGPDRRQRPAGGERPPGEQLVRCGPVGMGVDYGYVPNAWKKGVSAGRAWETQLAKYG
jgi:hypothetical protein